MRVESNGIPSYCRFRRGFKRSCINAAWVPLQPSGLLLVAAVVADKVESVCTILLERIGESSEEAVGDPLTLWTPAGVAGNGV